MIHKKLILGFSIVAVVVVLVTSATLPSGTLALNAQAQNADTSQQIRKYLIQAVKALDSGDNTEAIHQLELATDRMGTFTQYLTNLLMVKGIVMVTAMIEVKNQRRDQVKMQMNLEIQTKMMKKSRI
jgi:uncharacterized membrane protein YeiB